MPDAIVWIALGILLLHEAVSWTYHGEIKRMTERLNSAQNTVRFFAVIAFYVIVAATVLSIT